MQFDTQVSRTLYAEHRNTIALLEKLEARLLRNRPDQPPAADDRQIMNLLGQLRVLVQTELNIHFQFEEERLFPLVDAAGNADITRLLHEDHQIILPLAGQLVKLTDAAIQNGFTRDAWVEARRLGLELVERLGSHAQKEDMSLLPLLDALIDDTEDRELSDSYALMH